MGRALEALGQLRAARASYLRLLAMEAPEELKTLATARSKHLAAYENLAVLTLRDIPDGVQVQIDGRLEAGTELTLSPGGHRLCVIERGGAEVRCRQVTLEAGVRHLWSPANDSGASATLSWENRPGASGLSVDGEILLVDVGRLRWLDLDPGEHRVTMTRTGLDDVTVTLNLLPDTTRRLDDLLAPPGEALKPGAGPWPVVISTAGAITGGLGIGLLIAGTLQKASVKGATSGIASRPKIRLVEKNSGVTSITR